MHYLRAFFFIAALFAVLPVVAKTVEGRESASPTISLDGEWSFALDPLGTAPRGEWAQILPDAKSMTLPGRWADDSRLRDYNGVAWYSRNVTFPETGEKIQLVLERPVGAVEIFCDGAPLGAFFGNGLTRRMTLQAEPNQQHRMALRVDSTGLTPAMRQVVSCGLGPLRLEMLPATSFDSVQLTYAPTKRALLLAPTLTAPDASTVSLSWRITDNHAHPILRGKPITVSLVKGQNAVLPISISASRLKRWQADNPRLYRLRIEISQGGKTLDVYQTTFGISFSTLNGDGSLQVDRQGVMLKGLRIPGGVVPRAIPLAKNDARESELALAKRTGFNALMGDGMALSDEVLDDADRLGLMVIVAIPPAVGVPADQPGIAPPAIADTVKILGRHPSIIGWYWASAGASDDEVATLWQYDQSRIAFVRAADGALAYVPLATRGQTIVEIDEMLSGTPSIGNTPVLLSGTVAYATPAATLQGQESELAHFTGQRTMVEKVREAKRAIGYFVRPITGETLTDLSTLTGTLTRFQAAALAWNKPVVLAARMHVEGRSIRQEINLINDAKITGTNYRLHRLLTPPDGLARLTSQRAELSLLPSNPVQSLANDVDDLLDLAPGTYQVQYILTDGGRVVAQSQVVTFQIQEQAP